MEKGDSIKIRVTDVMEDGQGAGRAEDGRMVFVRRGNSGEVPLPGDLVRCEVKKLKKRYAQAELIAVEEASPLREDAEYCPHQAYCGGCPLGGLQYGEQLKLKRQHLIDAVQRIGGIADVPVGDAVGMGEDAEYGELHYRSKAVFTIAQEKGQPVVGFYQSRTHRVVDCPECRIQSPAALACADALRAFMKSDHVSAFDPRTGKGLLKNMIVRTAFGTGEVMVLFVINGKGIPNGEKLAEMLDDAVYALGDDPGYALTSVWINQNKGKTHELYGKNSLCLAGDRVIREEIGGMAFEITPTAFYQVNPYMMEKLYDQVADYADLKPGAGVLDLYCGAGTIGLWLSHRMNDQIELVGIESGREAVIAANRNAVINGIVHARYVTGKAEDEIANVLGLASADNEAAIDGAGAVSQAAAKSEDHSGEPDLTASAAAPAAPTLRNLGSADAKSPKRKKRSKTAAEAVNGANAATAATDGAANGTADEPSQAELESLLRVRLDSADCIILDPPRAGCAESLLHACVEANPEKIVYVSCEPPTLARDLHILTESGYRVLGMTPFDMFPQTGRLEAVAVLSR